VAFDSTPRFIFAASCSAAEAIVVSLSCKRRPQVTRWGCPEGAVSYS
jgi:hypothetical protein